MNNRTKKKKKKNLEKTLQFQEDIKVEKRKEKNLK